MAVSVGVLALQGCVTPHLQMFQRMGVDSKEIKSSADLSAIDRLVIPGGESTTMLKLLLNNPFLPDLQKFISSHPTWGVCAGAIVLAKEVTNPAQWSLGAINIRAHRNYYGSQLKSFKGKVTTSLTKLPADVDYIRAPRLTPLSPAVKVLGTLDDYPVLLQEKHILVSAFHAELGTNTTFHEYFLSLR